MLILISLSSYFLFSALSNVIIFPQGAASFMSAALWGGVGSLSIISYHRTSGRKGSEQPAQTCELCPQAKLYTLSFKALCARGSPHRAARGRSLSTTGAWSNMATPSDSCPHLYRCAWIPHYYTAPTGGYRMTFHCISRKTFSTSVLLVHR